MLRCPLDPDPDQNLECFTFLKLENPSSGSKFKGHQSLVLLDPDLSDLVMDLFFKIFFVSAAKMQWTSQHFWGYIDWIINGPVLSKTLNTQEYKLYVATVLIQIQTLMWLSHYGGSNMAL